MTPEQNAVLRELQAEGYALCVFTPEELEGVKPKSSRMPCANAASTPSAT